MPAHTPIPESLANLREPTRADAERVIAYSAIPAPPDRFEDTETGKRAAAGLNGHTPESTRELKRRWEQQRAAAIDATLARLKEEHADNLVKLRELELNNALAAQADEALAKADYLAVAGTSEATWKEDRADVLRARRLAGLAAVEEARTASMAEQRARLGL